MFIRMRESKGFTLVELMIVVAIIGILAAVAVPYYQRYIQRSRLTSLVMPGVHVLQTNVGSYFSLNGQFPSGASFAALLGDADSSYFSVTGPANANGTAITFKLNKGGAAGSTNPLLSLANSVLTCSAIGDAVMPNTTKIIGWAYSGNIATSMGLGGLQ
jgi:type IV pilus assembly protein PilA